MEEWKKNNQALLISTINIAEVLSLSDLSEERLKLIKNFLDSLVSVPVDNEVAHQAAYLRRKYSLMLVDAIIAATAVVKKVPLVTRDDDFRQIEEIEIVEL
jgi:predicted nucleic acid-binding protein